MKPQPNLKNDYNPEAIEKKWQKEWEKKKIYKTEKEQTGKKAKKKFYILDMFPYPSGEGLHVGHPKGYIATDVVSRLKRMQGFNVLHPMGFDAFGLPAENYAIKNKTNPTIAVAKNVAHYKKQLEILGFDYDWSREVNTTDPKYYKWTQWIFLKLLEKGLAYESYEPINWCPVDKTGLANEDVENGRCERCGAIVEKKLMRQWVLKITDYAERLLADLDAKDSEGKPLLNWPESIKEAQRNWIGKSEGAEIEFELSLPKYEGDMVFASNNAGKIKRIQKLLKGAGLNINLKTPQEVGIENFDVVEDGKTLRENSEKKAQTLARMLSQKTNLPVLAEDTGFFIPESDLDPVKVKRNALKGKDEKKLGVEGIAKLMRNYYIKLAASKGGKVDAVWNHDLCLITPEKFVMHVEASRPVILTDREKGAVDASLPLRGLYMSKVTGKYALEQTEEEEMKELEPITEALKKLFTPAMKVFTTRPDTLFGATYMVLAPEHPFVSAAFAKNMFTNGPEIVAYQEEVKKKTEIDRTDATKEKTGVELKGIKAINPANGEEIPVWIADYVLGDYGTGAVMAVPAHDERDFDFATKYNLPIKEVAVPNIVDIRNPSREGKKIVERKNVHAIVRNPKNGTYLALKWNTFDWMTFPMGGVEEEESLEEAARREIKEETGFVNLKLKQVLPGTVRAEYFAGHKDQNRVAYTNAVVFDLIDDEQIEISEEEKKNHEVVWLDKKELNGTFMTHVEVDIWNKMISNEKYVFTDAGYLTNSASFNGLTTEEAKKQITEYVGGKWVTKYKLREWVFSRQRYWGEPIPVLHAEDGSIIPLKEKDLPLELPAVKFYEPTDTGQSPLTAIKKWVEVKTGKGKNSHTLMRETNTMPQWAGSSWYYLRYMDPKNNKALVDPKNEKYWNEVDLYVGGAEHATRHLIYARFWHKFLFDIGVVSTIEPFRKLQPVGLIMAEDGRKMSKRWGNVVNPDDIVKTFGADTLRLYEMFMGPFDQAIAWNTNSMVGTRRFLERVWRLQDKIGKNENAKIETLIHKTIKKVEDDIVNMRFNTAVSSLMILLNEFDKVSNEKELIPEQYYKIFLQLLAPFAPHITEELWNKLSHKTKKQKSIHLEQWPHYDEKKLQEEHQTIAIQVNGKTRDTMEIETNEEEEGIRQKAVEREMVKKWLESKVIKKVIYIKGRIINIVVDEIR